MAVLQETGFQTNKFAAATRTLQELVHVPPASRVPPLPGSMKGVGSDEFARREEWLGRARLVNSQASAVSERAQHGPKSR